VRSSTARIRPDWLAFGWQENGEHRVVCSTEVIDVSMSAETEDITTMSSATKMPLVTAHILEARMGNYTIGSDATWRTAADRAGMDHIVGALGIPTEVLEMLYEVGAEHAETKEQIRALEMLAEYLGR